LPHGQLDAGLLGIGGFELRVQITEQLTRRVIGDVQQLNRSGAGHIPGDD
jgi:hypothetical protein